MRFFHFFSYKAIGLAKIPTFFKRNFFRSANKSTLHRNGLYPTSDAASQKRECGIGLERNANVLHWPAWRHHPQRQRKCAEKGPLSRIFSFRGVGKSGQFACRETNEARRRSRPSTEMATVGFLGHVCGGFARIRNGRGRRYGGKVGFVC